MLRKGTSLPQSKAIQRTLELKIPETNWMLKAFDRRKKLQYLYENLTYFLQTDPQGIGATWKNEWKRT